MRKLLGRDNNSLIGRCASKAKEGINSLHMCRCSAITRKAGLHHIIVTWEEKCHHSECPFVFLHLLLISLLNVTPCGLGYPTPAVSPPNSLFTGRMGREAEKALGSVQALLSNKQNIHVLFQPPVKTQPLTNCCKETYVYSSPNQHNSETTRILEKNF